MMRIVADDLTGSAEMGGVAWRYGLSTRVGVGTASGMSDRVTSDVQVIDTESRHLPRTDAARAVEHALAGYSGLVFKKTDSVLRGHVRAEIEAAMRALKKPRCLLLPCNPSLGRTIVNGVYYINDVELSQTDFRHDPSHPALTSRVVDLLEQTPGELPIASARPTDTMLPAGIVIGDAATSEDMQRWAERLDSDTLAAGAADFLGAILEHRGHSAHQRATSIDTGRTLLVSGSATESSRCELTRWESAGVALRMPPELFQPSPALNQRATEWASAAAAAFERHTRVALAIAQPATQGNNESLLEPLCDAAAQVIAQAAPDSVWVEGGSTAAALAARLRWTAFEVVREIAPGVVELAPDENPGMRFVLKPGSYRWSW
jgi:uncharacterized protein YgbK (DUF1537 family)